MLFAEGLCEYVTIGYEVRRDCVMALQFTDESCTGALLDRVCCHYVLQFRYVTIGYKVRRDRATALHSTDALRTEVLLGESC